MQCQSQHPLDAYLYQTLQYPQSSPVVSMVGGLHGVTLLHSMGRAGVEERSYSNGVEWSGVISGHSMELHGVPKGDVAKPNGA
jgi:subtilase family serine protease